MHIQTEPRDEQATFSVLGGDGESVLGGGALHAVCLDRDDARVPVHPEQGPGGLWDLDHQPVEDADVVSLGIVIVCGLHGQDLSPCGVGERRGLCKSNEMRDPSENGSNQRCCAACRTQHVHIM